MSPQRAQSGPVERAALVGLVTGSARRVQAEQSLEELAGLAGAAGATVVLRMLQERPKPDPATFIGAGKVASLAAACAEADVDVAIFDNELTPAQLRQLEDDSRAASRTRMIRTPRSSGSRPSRSRWPIRARQRS